MREWSPAWEDGEWEEVPEPSIKQHCILCKRQWVRMHPERDYDPDVVSIRGFGHRSSYSGLKLLCGIYAIGENWAWRL